MQKKWLQRWMNPIIKGVVAVAISAVLYAQVFKNDDLHHTIAILKNSIERHRGILAIVAFLTFFNWGFETAKWYRLINKLEAISIFTAIKGILFGITFSLFTPNRIGEYGGRVLALRHNRIAAIASSLVGSYAQIVANLSIGATSFILYIYLYLHAHFFIFIALVSLYLIAIAALIISYYNLAVATHYLRNISIFKKIYPYVAIVEQYSTSEMSILLLLSIGRYLIYCIQFILLLHIFDISLDFRQAFIHIPSIFFLQTLLPSLAIADIGLRSEISLQILQPFTLYAANIVAATVLLWLINLIIPGIIGAFAALGFNFYNED